MKVISINDAPYPDRGYYHNGVYIDRAYYKGNIFQVHTISKNFLVIYHHRLETLMHVDSNNFITIEEYREKKIDSILSK